MVTDSVVSCIPFNHQRADYTGVRYAPSFNVLPLPIFSVDLWHFKLESSLMVYWFSLRINSRCVDFTLTCIGLVLFMYSCDRLLWPWLVPMLKSFWHHTFPNRYSSLLCAFLPWTQLRKLRADGIWLVDDLTEILGWFIMVWNIIRTTPHFVCVTSTTTLKSYVKTNHWFWRAVWEIILRHNYWCFWMLLLLLFQGRSEYESQFKTWNGCLKKGTLAEPFAGLASVDLGIIYVTCCPVLSIPCTPSSHYFGAGTMPH